MFFFLRLCVQNKCFLCKLSGWNLILLNKNINSFCFWYDNNLIPFFLENENALWFGHINEWTFVDVCFCLKHCYSNPNHRKIIHKRKRIIFRTNDKKKCVKNWMNFPQLGQTPSEILTMNQFLLRLRSQCLNAQCTQSITFYTTLWQMNASNTFKLTFWTKQKMSVFSLCFCYNWEKKQILIKFLVKSSMEFHS